MTSLIGVMTTVPSTSQGHDGLSPMHMHWAGARVAPLGLHCSSQGLVMPAEHLLPAWLSWGWRTGPCPPTSFMVR